MIAHRTLATLVTAAAMTLASSATYAGDTYTFDSPSGALIAASVTGQGGWAPSIGGLAASSGATYLPPPLAVSPDSQYFGLRSRGLDAYSYRMLTHALSSASVANYAADYYRLFTPGLAVTTWTDRVSTGLVEVGYGNAVDSWTAGVYYLSRLHGSARRGESAPDLSLMPKFHAHPELQQSPTFTPN